MTATRVEMPAPGRLTLYLLGPGFGESIVVVLPDSRLLVVDVCLRASTNLPALLLERLGASAIDLLVVTHPDLDHLAGLVELVEQFKPKQIWRYPFALMREILHRVTRHDASERLTRARRAQEKLDEFAREEDAVLEIQRGHRWSPDPNTYSVHALAPSPRDTQRARDQVVLIDRDLGKPSLSQGAAAMLEGDRRLGDLPNMVSIGLGIEWGSRRVLLAGDIENGDGSPFSGWPGVLHGLDRLEPPLGHLVNDVDLIKIAHHGSRHAYSPIAWARHAGVGKTVGIATTFDRGKVPLPAQETLNELRNHCRQLGITANAGNAFARAHAAGWAPIASESPPTDAAAWLKIDLDANGTMTFDRGTEAGWFQ